jgi:hypothetical protein
MSEGGGGRERRDRPRTVDGVCGRPGHECLFAIEEYQLQCRFGRILITKFPKQLFGIIDSAEI